VFGLGFTVAHLAILGRLVGGRVAVAFDKLNAALAELGASALGEMEQR
jgi:hypothetical protein